jgi:hypothetical protein
MRTVSVLTACKIGMNSKSGFLKTATKKKRMTMTKIEREAQKRVFYQIVFKDQGMNILGATAGPFKTLEEAREAKKEHISAYRGGPVIRKVTYEIIE